MKAGLVLTLKNSLLSWCRIGSFKGFMGTFCRYAFHLLVAMLVLMPSPGMAIPLGALAPDFRLPDLEGRQVSLSDFRGQVVLVKLATTWCPSCSQLSSELAQAGEFLKESNVVLLDVFVQDTKEMVAQYLEKHSYPMTFNALIDDGQAYKAYNVYLIPRLLVIDPQGVARYDSAGQVPTATELRGLVTEALGEKSG
ncbi:MAG: hypothetical protein C0614_08335 [Desulfuromonas sp.]|nr:MAG: hypothetical protein C0614_08335 [Desulfuromonas sp.]